MRQAANDSNESASLLRRLIAVEANTEFATAQRLDPRLVPPSGSPARPSPTR